MPRCKGICTCCCSGAGPYVSFNMGTIWRSAAKKRLREHAQGSPPGTANQIAACQHGVEKSHGTHASSLCLRISKSPCYSLRLLSRSASTQAKRQCVTSLTAVFTDSKQHTAHTLQRHPNGTTVPAPKRTQPSDRTRAAATAGQLQSAPRVV